MSKPFRIHVGHTSQATNERFRPFFAALAASIVWAVCAPSQSVNRVSVDRNTDGNRPGETRDANPGITSETAPGPDGNNGSDGGGSGTATGSGGVAGASGDAAVVGMGGITPSETGGMGGAASGGADGAGAGGIVSPPPMGGTGGAMPVDVAPPPMDAADPSDVAETGGKRKAFLVVAEAAAPGTGDKKVEAVIVGKGFAVTIGDDDGAATAATGFDLVVLAGSSVAEKLAGKFRDTPIPTLVLEPSVFDDMKMTSTKDGTDFGEDGGTAITILANPGPLAAGLTGNVTVAATGGKLGWGKPAATAMRAATFSGNAAKTTIFAYEKGVVMVSPTLAPARRAGLFAGMVASPILTAQGEQLIGAAIDWLTAK